jgi:uncharacterized protein (DUF427 family)
MQRTPHLVPLQGRGSYYDIIDGDEIDLTAGVWYYEEPVPAVSDIKDYVAFYPDQVIVTATSSESTAMIIDRPV